MEPPNSPSFMPLDDPLRISLLRRAGVLDSPAEESFDRYTRLATRVLGVPVALVSLVEGHRQFFKSCVGLPQPWATERETPLSHSFCQHVVRRATPLIIEDARQDDLVRENLAIRDLSVIAYAGFPIVVRPGVVLGSFCVIDSQPRKWTPEDLRIVQDLATAVSTEIELRLDLAERAETIESGQRELSSVVESSTDAIISTTLDGTITSWNSGAARLYGYEAEQAVGQSISLIIPPDRRAEMPDLLGQLHGGRHVAHRDTMRVRSDGTVLDILLTVTPLRDALGRVVGACSVGRDVTEQKRAAEAIRLSEERFRLVSEATRDVIYDYDLSTGRVVWSDAVRELLGPHVPALGSGWWGEHLHPADADRVLNHLHEALAGDAEVCSMEYRLRRVDGEYASIAERGRIIRGPGGAAVRMVGALQNLTERRRAEEQLLESQRQLAQAQKIDALGRLSGGIAHDFNNLLTVINASAEFLLHDMQGGQPLADDVRAIQDAGERAADLTRQLLAFSRNQVVQPRVVDVNEAVAGMDRMLSRLIGADILREVVPAPEAGPVLVDPTQLEQVLLNLALNARDAMPAGGTLRIRTLATELRPGEAEPGPDQPPPGRYAGVAITDSGHGMDGDTRQRIFEPFFTTKQSGKGTGLGLATVYGIVKQAGGYITVESEPGQGTSMTVLFPVTDAVDAPEPEPQGMDAAPDGRVLVVEDDPVVRGIITRMLTRSGYAVASVCSAEDAVGLLEEEGDTIDVVLTDVVMPGMGGGALVRHVAEHHAHIPVVCISGYTDDVIAPQGVLVPELRLLRKPFSQAQLVRALTAVLHRSGSARQPSAS
ncbi:PAS domain S-box protein [Longimicrobium terrae]|uniref:histidine kinase n=1 Tax=Longimicrobium terrae TaxID=1639882 RepID=A0A841GX70_9BACT|nr:PAS domain S-box protein [Longimicrobium terrae]MBB4635082.1 PAS domain S-box-containing protein [Longimicrobium terrae]MBB6069476.1 PAS domain S-box-containing protein [Longimicrobium terrae]NNC31721.1 PAS domain S-box protein [Longimicrobium terrae]